MHHLLQGQLSYTLEAWDNGLSASVRDDWEALIAGNPATSIFSYPEWFESARETGVVKPWRILVIRRDQRPICLLPLRRRSPWAAETCNPLSEDFPPLLIDPHAEELAWAGLADWVQHNPSIRILSLGRWRDPTRIELCRQAAESHGVYAYTRAMESEIWCYLPESWDAYLSQIGANTRRNVNRSEANIRRDIWDFTLTFLEDPNAGREPMNELITFHHTRWHGQKGSFFDDMQKREFYKKAVFWAMRRHFATMPVLQLNGQTIVVATLFHIPGQDYAYSHCIGRDMTALPPRYSPGIVVVSAIIRWMIEHGVKSFAFGVGTPFYKKLLGGKEVERWEVFIARSKSDATVLAKLDAGINKLLGLPREIQYRLQRPKKEVSKGEDEE